MRHLAALRLRALLDRCWKDVRELPDRPTVDRPPDPPAHDDAASEIKIAREPSGTGRFVGLCRNRHERAEVDDHLQELGLLAETAGAVVVGAVVQGPGSSSAGTLVRRGKVASWRCWHARRRADLASSTKTSRRPRSRKPREGRRGEDPGPLRPSRHLRAPRPHARARTQVELAQLRYLLPRLTRQ